MYWDPINFKPSGKLTTNKASYFVQLERIFNFSGSIPNFLRETVVPYLCLIKTVKCIIISTQNLENYFFIFDLNNMCRQQKLLMYILFKTIKNSDSKKNCKYSLMWFPCKSRIYYVKHDYVKYIKIYFSKQTEFRSNIICRTWH